MKYTIKLIKRDIKEWWRRRPLGVRVLGGMAISVALISWGLSLYGAPVQAREWLQACMIFLGAAYIFDWGYNDRVKDEEWAELQRARERLYGAKADE